MAEDSVSTTTTAAVSSPAADDTSTAATSSPADPPSSTTAFGPQFSPTTTAAPVDAPDLPSIDSFTGALKVSDGRFQIPDSLQVDIGSPVVLTWKATNASSGVELTDPARAGVQMFAAEATAEVTPNQEIQDYSLVAVNGGWRSPASTVHVSTNPQGAMVSGHAAVSLDREEQEGMEIVLGALSETLLHKDWPEGGAHFTVGVALKADFELVFTGAEAEKPDLETAKAEVRKGLLSLFEANFESPLLSAIKNPDFTVTAAGMTEAKLLEQSREKGEKSYTFGELNLIEVKLSTPGIDEGVITFDMSLALAEANFEKPLDSGLGVLTGTATATLIDAKAGVKDIGIGHGLEVKGSLAAELEAKFISITATDLLKKAGVTIAKDVGMDVIIDSGVKFFDGVAGETAVDGVIACASVAGSVALVIFVGYEVGEAFSSLAKADRENDFGIKIKYDDNYVPGVMADVRKQLDLGVSFTLRGGVVVPLAGEITVEGGKLANETRSRLQQALRARNQNLEDDKFQSLFNTYVATNQDAIAGALDKELKELTQFFAWLQLVRDGMPMNLQFGNLEDEQPVRPVWAVAWQRIFGDDITTLLMIITDDDWKADSNILLTGNVVGQAKWKVLQQSHAWMVAQD